MEDTEAANWDLFISHASEDKKELVEPLAKALSDFGVNVWYDEYQLKLGDSLSRSIDKGLARSNYGLVVLSAAFFAKRWPEYELRGLTTREVLGGKKILLPIWYRVSAEDILKFSPTLADKLAVRVGNQKPVEIAIKIIESIRPDIFSKILRRLAYKKMLRSAALEQRDPRSIKPSPIRHSELPADLIGRIRLVRAALLGVHPHSMKSWMLGFQRDSHPSGEVRIWEHIAAVYVEYISMHESAALSASKASAIFSCLLTLSLGIIVPPSGKEITADEFDCIKSMYGQIMPVYDIDEKIADVDADDVSEVLDQEHFPLDLPDNLIEEILSIKKTPSGE